MHRQVAQARRTAVEQSLDTSRSVSIGGGRSFWGLNLEVARIFTASDIEGTRSRVYQGC